MARVQAGYNVPTNINRIDTPRRIYALNSRYKRRLKKVCKTCGWQVRIKRAREEIYISKLFSDTKYGGTKKALTAAKLFLKEKLTQVPAPLKPNCCCIKPMRREHHTTMIPGVRLHWSPKIGRKVKQLYVVVYWTDTNKKFQPSTYIGTDKTTTPQKIVDAVNRARDKRIKMIKKIDPTFRASKQHFPIFTLSMAEQFLKTGYVTRGE
jgi:hypothetical protein